MNLLKILIFIILLTVSKTSFAKVKPYFDESLINPNLIEKPFKIGDENWRKEINFIVNLQNNFDLERLDQAANEKKLQPETFTFYINKKLTRQNYQNLYQMLARVEITSINLTKYLKEYFKITRPYLASNEVKMLISPSKGYAYPSGHTSGSFIYAYVLMEIFPEKKNNLLNFANQIANNRILVGMHYPQDIKAGKALALLTIKFLKENQEFLEDLEKAKIEIEKLY